MLTRRTLLAGLLGASGAAVAGCAANPVTPGAAPAEVAAGTAAVTHKFGTTTVPAGVRRVVSVGITEQDPLLALGVRPVAVTEWYGEQPLATWDWARSRFGGQKPEVLSTTDGFAVEKIAQLEPDLIIGTNSGMERKDFDQLSAIAPTVANSGSYSSDYFEPWTVQTTLIAAALGQVARGQQLIDDLAGRFAAAAAAHPEFAGRKVIFLQGGFSEGSAIASQNGLGTAFLTDLGFRVPAELDAFSKDGNQAYVPLERLDVLNTADLLVWASDDAAAGAERKANPVYQRLEAVRAGRSIDTGELLAAAIYFSTVLSLPLVVDQLVPKLAAALQA